MGVPNERIQEATKKWIRDAFARRERRDYAEKYRGAPSSESEIEERLEELTSALFMVTKYLKDYDEDFGANEFTTVRKILERQIKEMQHGNKTATSFEQEEDAEQLRNWNIHNPLGYVTSQLEGVIRPEILFQDIAAELESALLDDLSSARFVQVVDSEFVDHPSFDDFFGSNPDTSLPRVVELTVKARITKVSLLTKILRQGHLRDKMTFANFFNDTPNAMLKMMALRAWNKWMVPVSDTPMESDDFDAVLKLLVLNKLVPPMVRSFLDEKDVAKTWGDLDIRIDDNWISVVAPLTVAWEYQGMGKWARVQESVSKVAKAYLAKVAAPNAKAEYEKRFGTVKGLLAKLVKTIEADEKAFAKKGGTDWGFVGSMDHVVEQLSGILKETYNRPAATRDSSAVVFALRVKQAKGLIRRIDKYLDDDKKAFEKSGGTDWGYTGSMGFYQQILSELAETRN